MKAIGIIGASGNMGQRYSRILDMLGVDVVAFDENDWRDAPRYKKDLHSIIVASPTEFHFENLLVLDDFKVLCEKPISKDIDQVRKVCEKIKCLRMVNQYEHLIPSASRGLEDSHYNYFKTGSDGLEWDCINIIGLAKNPPHIFNDSPIWKCKINGHELNLGDMDLAYVRMIKEWVKQPASNKRYMIQAHERVLEGAYKCAK